MLPKPHQEWYRGNAKRRELNIVSYVNNFDIIIIEISDNGVGMNKEQINRFGEPYYSSKEKELGWDLWWLSRPSKR